MLWFYINLNNLNLLMKKIYFAYLFLMLCHSVLQAQSTLERPKLVVGIVVDQMRYDYLYRFYDKYSEGGFKRLMNQGFNCKNGHYNYVPTETAPGHASIYTGTTPSFHGIVGNDWFENGETMYCVQDTTVKTVGAVTLSGLMSPLNLLTTTMTDQLKLATNQKSKVIGISIKDRGSILPAGHMADMSFWLDKSNGKFISSSFYMNDLPKWVQEYNDMKPADNFLSQTWNTLLPIESYTESTTDDKAFERVLEGKDKATFPYNLADMSAKIKNSQMKVSIYDILTTTPFGNTLVKEMAMKAIINENLGKNTQTDFLAISFSSPDYVGHAFGPNSIEMEDIYLRLDRELAELLEYFDKEVGNGNYLLFLTADHAGVEIPAYSQELKQNVGYMKVKKMYDDVNEYLDGLYGAEEWLDRYLGEKQIYLNRDLIEQKGMDISQVQQKVADYVGKIPGVYATYTATELQMGNQSNYVKQLVQNGQYARRSGDVSVVLEAGWLSDFWEKRGGTSHGTPFSYDTHVPMLFYGWQVKQGSSVKNYKIVDIAPTICNFLNIQFPSGCTGNPIEELFK